MPTSTVVPPPTRQGRALVVTGVALVVVGLVGAAALSLVARNRVEATVRDLARAPVGCDTTLDFSDTGTFVLFVETAGRIDGLSGGCEAPTRYDRREATTPRVTIELVDPSGRDVPIDPTDAEGYDIAGFRATPAGEVAVDATGRHVVRVTSSEGGVVVAIGRDPAAVGTPLTAAALAVAAVGVLGGGAALVVGVVRGRRPSPPTSASSASRASPGDPWRDPRTQDVSPSAPPQAPPPPGAVVSPPSDGAPPRPGAPLPPPTGPRYG